MQLLGIVSASLKATHQRYHKSVVFGKRPSKKNEDFGCGLVADLVKKLTEKLTGGVGAGAGHGWVLRVGWLVTPLSPYSPPSPSLKAVPESKEITGEGGDIVWGFK